jgi:hypothetical protein
MDGSFKEPLPVRWTVCCRIYVSLDCRTLTRKAPDEPVAFAGLDQAHRKYDAAGGWLTSAECARWWL